MTDWLLRWLQGSYESFFRLLGFIYRTFTSNRQRLAEITRQPWLAKMLRGLIYLTLIVWLLIWLVAPDASRQRLTDEFRHWLGDTPAPAMVPTPQ